MSRIAIIGAGSLVFTRNLCSDIFLTPALRDSTVALMDIDPARLAWAREVVETLARHHGSRGRVEAHLDRRQALRGARYVVTTFQQGGLEAYRLDVEIPQRYGVEQCVGDTLGPGGVFRALRTIPVLLDLCREMDQVAPEALLLNYVNPMAANCWAVHLATGRPHVGLCHSVQGTAEMLAGWLEVPYEEVAYRCAGINHQAFFLELQRRQEDLYPRLWRAIERQDIQGQEPVRVELMQRFGYFVTESSGHASEYVPYFRRSARMVEEELVPRFRGPGSDWYDDGRTGGYLRHCLQRAAEAEGEFLALARGQVPMPERRSREYCSHLLEAVETGRPAEINGNVPNDGLIENLPPGSCVEVPCLVDGRGVHPRPVGRLPAQLAALNQACIQVQGLMVEAAVHGKRDAVFHAVTLDPLTAAACRLSDIQRMVEDMLEAQARWLPGLA